MRADAGDPYSDRDARRRARQGLAFVVLLTTVVLGFAIAVAAWMYWLAAMAGPSSPNS